MRKTVWRDLRTQTDFLRRQACQSLQAAYEEQKRQDMRDEIRGKAVHRVGNTIKPAKAAAKCLLIPCIRENRTKRIARLLRHLQKVIL